MIRSERCAALGGLYLDNVAHVTNTRAWLLVLIAQFACSSLSQAQRPDAFELAARERWEFVMRNRAFIIPERVVQGLPMQPTLGFWYRPTRRIQLGVDAQTVDNSGPGVQGNYLVSRTVPNGGSGNFLQEITYDARVALLPASSRHRLDVELTWSRAVRSYFAIERTTHDSVWGNRRRDVPMIEANYVQRSRSAEVGLGGVIAWLARDDALYLRALPGETRHFGTLTGLRANGALRLTAPLRSFVRAFVPLTGNNSIARPDGRPARVLAYDAGLQLALSAYATGEVFISNTLGNTGALSVVADREYRALGAGLRVYPQAARERDQDALVRDAEHPSPLGLASISGVWLPSGAASARVRRSGQGTLAAGEWAPVRGVQGGIFLDLLDGVRDEGELGGVIRVALLANRGDHVPNVAVVTAASRTNNPLVNLLAGSWEEIRRLGLPKGSFNFGDENGLEGRLYTITVALPVEWYVGATTIRLAPTAGYVQRNGVQLSGVSLGVQRALTQRLSVGGDIGVAIGEGNVILRNGRSHAIPFGVTTAWHRDGAASATKFPLALEAFLTNRAGDSPFHSLRVRADRALSAGLGIRIGRR